MHVMSLYWQTTQRPCITSYRFLLVVRRVWKSTDEAGWMHAVLLYWKTTQRPCITSYRFLLVVRRVWKSTDEAG